MSSELPKELTFADDDGEYMRLCIDITLYWTASLFVVADGLERFYRRALEVIGPELSYYETETMAGARRIRGDTLEMLPLWLSQTQRKRRIYMLTLHGGDTPDGPSDTAFVLNHSETEGERAGAVRLLLPIDRFQDNWAGLAALARDLAQGFPLDSGHGGFGLSWDEKGERAVDAIARFPFVARRFPGIDIPDLDVTLYAMAHAKGPGIKRVSWLTFLGSALVEAAGGSAAIAADLDPECRVHPLDYGMMIQAGERPDTGDTNRGRTLEDYRCVGRRLAGLRLPEHPELIGSPRADAEDITAEWLAQFDD